MAKNIVIIGASGAIGNAFAVHFSEAYPDAKVTAFSRHGSKNLPPGATCCRIDYNDEASIEKSALTASRDAPLDMVIVATGILHDGDLRPEKSLRDITAENFQRLFAANVVVPALIAKHFLPALHTERRSVFAALSARVGSVSDNRLGGWYAYRTSKAALNMVIKNAAIEIARKNQHAVIVGLHPGTVDSTLSKPFQKNIPPEKVFSPQESVRKLVGVLENLAPEHTGKLFSWDGEEISP